MPSIEFQAQLGLLLTEHPDLFPTEAKFWSWLRGCLRRGIWERSPMKLKAKNSLCSPPPPDYKGRGKSGANCALTRQWEVKSKLEVDHKEGHVSFKSEEDIIPFITHLLASGEQLQLVTKEAHKVKSLADRRGISFEEALIEKQLIAFKKLKAEEQRQKLNGLGLDTLGASDQRVKTYRNYLRRANGK